MKKCQHCKISQPFENFYKNKRKSDGLDPECKHCQLLRKKFYYQQNKEKIDAKHRKWRTDNRSRSNAIRRKWYHGHKDEARIYGAQWRARNKDYPTKWARLQRQDNLIFCLKDNLRCRLYRALKGRAKNGSAVQDLGCSMEELKHHLEKQFYTRVTGEEMTWDNHSLNGWHVDHIVPLSSFNLTERNQLLKACHFTNLQPLWCEDNYAKGAHYECKD